MDRRRYPQHDGLPGDPQVETVKLLAAVLTLALAPAAQAADTGLDPAVIGKPATDTWTTYHGDYRAPLQHPRRVDHTNVKNLTLAWVYRANSSSTGAQVGGEGTEKPAEGEAASVSRIKSTPLLVNGVLYFTAPDHVWAVDARTGRGTWHYVPGEQRAAIQVGNRGVGMWGETASSSAPTAGSSRSRPRTARRWAQRSPTRSARVRLDDRPPCRPGPHHRWRGRGALDVPGYLESRDPETGDLQRWRWHTTPQKVGDPGPKRGRPRTRWTRRRHAVTCPARTIRSPT